MKLIINFNNIDKFEIDFPIIKIGDIYKEIKRKIECLCCDLIYENIILDSSKLFKFYQISESDEIWYGPIGNYLKEDEVIMELFIPISDGDIIYIIIKKSDSISKIKSIINKIIPNIFNIWNMKGQQLEDYQIISDIDFEDEYYKLIVDVEPDDGIFEEFCEIHDDYFMHNLLSEFVMINYYDLFDKGKSIIDLLYIEMHEWIGCFIRKKNTLLDSKYLNLLETFDENNYSQKIYNFGINEWKARINNAKQEVMSKPIYDYYFPSGYAFSVFWLFNEIFDLTDDLLLEFTDYHWKFKAILIIAIKYYIQQQKYHLNIADKSIRNILSDILNYCGNIFYHLDDKFECLVEQLVNSFTVISYTYDEICDIFDDYPDAMTISFMFKRQKLWIPSIKPKTILDVQKAAEYQTKYPKEQFFIINSVGEKPNDNEKFQTDYDIEFSRPMDDIDILRMLGSGAFGNVYLCEDKFFRKQFVLKVPFNNQNDLTRDIVINRHLRHSKTLLSYSELFRYNGRICMAMEYLTKGSLSSYLEKNNIISEIQIAKWCHQILIQINDLHKQRIIHRDIKGDNITLDENLKAHLIDFGVSKYADEKVLVKNYFVGTRNYMAPEYIDKETYSNKIDIWSFGATVIEMVSGEMPFSKMNPVQASFQISKAKKIRYKPRQRISNELKDFIDLCLTPNENERPSAEQLIQSQFILNNWNEINK